MISRTHLLAICFIAGAFSTRLFGEVLPDYLAPIASQIEECIAKADTGSSRALISYDQLRHNFAARWWSLLGYQNIPTEEFIRKNPDLWNAGTVVKLSVEQYCTDISGVRLLLHGGVAKDQVKDRKVFASIQSVEVATNLVRVTTDGDNDKPVVSVFEKIDGKWLLSDVILQFQ